MRTGLGVLFDVVLLSKFYVHVGLGSGKGDGVVELLLVGGDGVGGDELLVVGGEGGSGELLGNFVLDSSFTCSLFRSA